MRDAARHQHNQDRLRELHPRFAAGVQALLDELESEGWRPRIDQAWRSPEQQRLAFECGHTLHRSGLHTRVTADGRPQAMAVDLVDDDAPHMPGRPFLLRLAAAAEAAGLVTGIRWGLPAALARGIDDAIAHREWNAPVKIGWDPAHVQPRDTGAALARRGARRGAA